MWNQVAHDERWREQRFAAKPDKSMRALCTTIGIVHTRLLHTLATCRPHLQRMAALDSGARCTDDGDNHLAEWKSARDVSDTHWRAQRPLVARRHSVNVTLAYVPLFYRLVYGRVTYCPPLSHVASRVADHDARALDHMMQHLHVLSDAWTCKSAWTIDLWFLCIRCGTIAVIDALCDAGPSWAHTVLPCPSPSDDEPSSTERLPALTNDAQTRSSLYTRYASMLNSWMSVLLTVGELGDDQRPASAEERDPHRRLCRMRATCACPMCTVPVTSSIVDREIRAIVRLGLASDELEAARVTLVIPVVLYLPANDAATHGRGGVRPVRTTWYVCALSLLGWVNRAYRAGAQRVLASSADTTRRGRRSAQNAATADRDFIHLDRCMCDLAAAALRAHGDECVLGDDADAVRAFLSDRQNYIGDERARSFGIRTRVARAVYAHDLLAGDAHDLPCNDELVHESEVPVPPRATNASPSCLACSAHAQTPADPDAWLRVNSGHHSSPSVMGPTSITNMLRDDMDALKSLSAHLT